MGLILSCRRQSPWICVVFWCGSGPFLYCFAVFSAGETQIWPGDLRVVAVAVFLSVLLVFPWFASFVKPKVSYFLHTFLPLLSEPESEIGRNRGNKSRTLAPGFPSSGSSD